MKSNFEFLNIYWSELAELGTKAEKQLYYDNNACVNTIGTYAEKLTEEILNSEHLPEHLEKNQFQKLEILKTQKIISDSALSSFHSIRILRNKAIHENERVSVKEAQDALCHAYELGKWFIRNYSDKKVDILPFEMPEKETKKQSVKKAESTSNVEANGSKSAAITILTFLLVLSVLLNIWLLTH